MIYGTIDELKDFDLRYEGKVKDLEDLLGKYLKIARQEELMDIGGIGPKKYGELEELIKI